VTDEPRPGQPPPAPEPKPAAPAKPPVVLPDPVFNTANGRLLFAEDRLWPNRVWKGMFSLPRYRNGALMLAGIIVAGTAFVAAVGELDSRVRPVFNWLSAQAAALSLPALLFPAAWIVVKVLAITGVIVAAPIFLVWWERKISAHMQSRFGPMVTGGFHGWLQTVADGIKLFLKENITPVTADRWVHLLGPIVALGPVFLAFAPVCFGRELAAADLDIGVVYIFAMTGVSVLGIMMAGWGSGNKYSLLGGLRAAAQLVSYEIPRAFSVIPVIMLAGSLNLTKIVAAQSGWWFDGIPVLPRWFIFYPVVGQLSFLIFLITSVAETNRTPFDIPEAESELVSGFHTEYSGLKFSFFFLAEYAYMTLGCCLMAAFFLGGGAAPWPFLSFIPSWAWFTVKVLGLVFCFMWFRWTFPRFRVDRLMDFNWKFLLPWSFANIAIAGLYVML